jgi:hypothetical protein
MDVGQIFGTAGASGGVIIAVAILYKLLQSSHCRSNCCGRIVSVDVSQKTPPPELQTNERRPSVFVPKDEEKKAEAV